MSDTQERIKRGKSTTFNFLPDSEHPDVSRILSAFANTEGGQLLLGVKNNGKVIGVLPAEQEQLIKSILEERLSPVLKVEFEKIQLGHHLLLAVWVKSGNKKYKCLDSDGNWKYFISGENGYAEANKITKGVWKMVVRKDPNVGFSVDEEQLLALIKRFGPISLSQIYKQSDLSKSSVDEALVKLVFNGMVLELIGESVLQYVVDIEAV